jgi:hypothetical protein
MTKIERAIIGVDGDHAFALAGADLQEGEAEFVKIDCTEPKWTSAYEIAASYAATKALNNLRLRLKKPITYALDPSHPRYC